MLGILCRVLIEEQMPPLPQLLAFDPDWELTELAGEGIGERGEGVPVLLATHGEGACVTLEEFLKCSLRVREYFTAVSFL